MSENSKIEWTDHTFNPWEGCQAVSPGCDHCYAEARNARFGGGVAVNWGPGAPRRRTSAHNWNSPVLWNNRARREGRRYRVFCASLADWADNAAPIEWLVDLLELVRTTPHLDWLMLTKRIGIVLQRLQEAHSWVLDNWPAVDAQPLSQWLSDWLEGGNPPANVWLGATIVDQEEADRDIPKLLRVPARVRFLSMEPLLGPVNLQVIPWGGIRTNVLQGWERPDHGVHWVIVGGESGPDARPMHPGWARDLRDQCQAAGVPSCSSNGASGRQGKTSSASAAPWTRPPSKRTAGTSARSTWPPMTGTSTMSPICTAWARRPPAVCWTAAPGTSSPRHDHRPASPDPAGTHGTGQRRLPRRPAPVGERRRA